MSTNYRVRSEPNHFIHTHTGMAKGRGGRNYEESCGEGKKKVKLASEAP